MQAHWEAPGVTYVHLRTAIEQSPLATLVFGPDGRYLLLNAAWSRLWGLGEGEESPAAACSNAFEDDRLRALGLVPYPREAMAGGEVTTPLLLRGSARTTGAEGGTRWLRAFVYPVRDEAGRLLQVGLMLEDFTERKALEEELDRRASHDPLTGLPNRALFMDRLRHALSRTRQEAERGTTGEVALLFVDLDDFKRVNDSLGHDAGDRLLVGVSERVGACLRPGDTLARFGGDEFAVLVESGGYEGGETKIAAEEIAKRIARSLRPPFALRGHEVSVTASIGIVVETSGAAGEERAEDLLRVADVAMYRGKSGGKDRYEIFHPRMDRMLERLELEEDLRRALEREEFGLHYQPKVLVGTGEIAGFEALVRWEHPERGLLAPSGFVGLAEETGLIVPVGRWVLRQACRQAVAFRERIPPGSPLKICVNLSAGQFRHPELADEVAAVLSETGLAPRDLALEITESAIMADVAAAGAVLSALKELGVTLVMDDFGTGYSSISCLKRFPVDMLKIDRSLVEGMDADPEGLAIVSATIALAHGLGLAMVAEGVETAGELEKLRSLGCDFAQGYHWQKPLPAEQATRLLVAGPDGRP